MPKFAGKKKGPPFGGFAVLPMSETAGVNPLVATLGIAEEFLWVLLVFVAKILFLSAVHTELFVFLDFAVLMPGVVKFNSSST